MDPAQPHAEAVAVHDGRIVAVGEARETARALDADAERVDCAGGTLLPGFIDAHCHLLAYAASLASVDCTAAGSISDIQEAIRRRAEELPAGQWVRAFGYEETSLVERRHPNRHELDGAAPDHPVRLIHGSGHASVLNSLALRLAGIDNTTEEPAGGVMERDLSSGEPTGVLLGMERLIERAVAPLPYAELAAGVRQASQRLLQAGVTCVQDATHTNGRAEWELFERLIADGSLSLDVVLMEGIEHLGELPERGGEGRLRRGAAKIMLHELGDDIWPDERELGRLVMEAHDAGRQVAIHAVGERAVAAAAESIERALGDSPRGDHRHRIEHCGLLPDGLAPRLARLGVTVVSQPSFLFERGERYVRLVPKEQQPSLYPFRTLQQAGVAIAAGSDAPVTQPAPLASVAAAVERRTADGRPIASAEAVRAEVALGWWTSGAAHAAFLERERGTVAAGMRADLVLLPTDPLVSSPTALLELAIERRWVAGRSGELTDVERA